MDISGPEMLWARGGLLAQSLSIFDPASPSASSIVNLAILTLAIAVVIFLVVEGVLLYSLWRFRQPPGALSGEPPQVYGSMPIEVAWTAAPTLVVFFLVLVTARTLWDVETSPRQPQPDDNALFVTVIGHQWWWEYGYESYNGRPLDFITANELHIPLSEQGTPRRIYLTLKSADVCHSFWVPRLGGKVDLIPGRTNLLAFETEHAGLYLGQCAEFCGAQHAHMLIRVIAEEPEEFDQWLQRQSQPAEEDPSASEGQAAFVVQSCINCHTVRGTPARGTYAPDLTHLMSRATIGSGMIENTATNLTQWLRDPQQVKPGCLMPAFGLDDRQLELIAQYLQSLR